MVAPRTKLDHCVVHVTAGNSDLCFRDPDGSSLMELISHAP
ncbi:MAG TPA: hypothetical protein VGH67_00690 [Solirubrobacteraceae bacterium]|jgi:hypothetical protein